MTLRSGRVVTLVAGVSVSMAGCATVGSQYHVNVSGLMDSQSTGKQTYALRPGSAGVGVGDVQFREFATYVHRALQSRGYERSAEDGRADVLVVLQYGSGDPDTETDAHPVLG